MAAGFSGYVGFIGTGTMGSILIDAFLRARAFMPEQLIIHNRTPQKAYAIAHKHHGIAVASCNVEVAKQAELLFLCVKPLEFQKVLDEITPYLRPSQTVVVITSPIQLAHLEERIPCKLIKFIPSITNLAHSGACLLTYHPRISIAEQEQLSQLFAQIGTPIEIPETYTRVASDLSSCGPAFLSYILDQLATAAAEETEIPRELADLLVILMLDGTTQLLTQEGLSLEEIRQRVSVPGGITQQGLDLLAAQMDGLFQQLFQITHAKFMEDVKKVQDILGNK